MLFLGSVSRSALLRPVAHAGLLTVLASCSAGETAPPPRATTGTPTGSNTPPPVLTDNGDPTLVPDDGDTSGVGSGANPPRAPNLGTETVCDDIDDNANGIIDDVDVGKDGLCDCIHIGFFGGIASDAGMATAAFDTWLIERSGQIPIKRLASTDTLTADWLSSLQVLIVGGLKERAAAAGSGAAFTADEIAAFDAWVSEQGGGVFTLSGYTANATDARPVSELLQHSGLAYDTTNVPAAGVISNGGPPVWLTDIVTPTHPTVEGVNQVGVFYGYPVTGDGTPILDGEGYTLAMAKQWGIGRVFAFADEWITQDATWSGLANGQADPCQQPCNEQANICRIATEQCANCEEQPCSDPADTDITTCSKGCQPSCESETTRCATNTALCETCTADVDAREQATPRLWLNTIRWLTPANECQVAIPPNVSVRVR
jgi:hypothetical protein